MEELVSAKELAKLLGVKEDWLYEKAAAGEIPSFKFGGHRRFRVSEVEAWLEQTRERAKVRPLRAV